MSTEPQDERCKHCGKRIVKTRFLGRDRWTHQPAGAAFQDGQHEFCHLTIAAPPTARAGTDEQEA